jgi:hypothetical protein
MDYSPFSHGRSSHSLLVVVAALLAAGMAVTPTLGAEEDSEDMVQVPVSQLREITEELRYLRERDREQQQWQDSVTRHLPTSVFQATGHSTWIDDDQDATKGKAFCGDSCSSSFGGSSACCCGRCFRCQCPLPTAPCLDCNHVSTLAPYFNINVFGALKLDMIASTARAATPGTPFFLFPDTVAGFDQDNVSFHARQSTIGAALAGPQVGSLQSGGAIVAMFFNDAVLNDQYGFLPLQAFGELKNDDWRLAGGLMFDVFAPGIPTVLPFSALAASGNAGNSFRGQLRLERFIYPARDVQWTMQAALSEPITSTINSDFQLLEDNGWPNLEGRIALGLGNVQGAGAAAKRPFELGLSGVVGQLRQTTADGLTRVESDVWGTAIDARWNLSDRLGMMAEVYHGQGLGTYNAAISQTVNPTTFNTIRSTGGFGEVYFYWTPCLHTHVGYGVDDPLDRDVDAAPLALGRTFNSTLYSNILWDLNQTFRVGFEFTWRETNYRAPALPDNEGAGFHTQLQWVF